MVIPLCMWALGHLSDAYHATAACMGKPCVSRHASKARLGQASGMSCGEEGIALYKAQHPKWLWTQPGAGAMTPAAAAELPLRLRANLAFQPRVRIGALPP